MIRAKEIFFNYSGSGFQMMRDGVLDEYKSYKVSKELEYVWLNELVDREFDRLNINSFDSFFPLWYIVANYRLLNVTIRIQEFISKNANYPSQIVPFLDKAITVFSELKTDSEWTETNELSYQKLIKLKSQLKTN